MPSGSAISVASPDLEGRFTNVLTANTLYDVTVYGVKASQPDALGLDVKQMKTPPAGCVLQGRSGRLGARSGRKEAAAVPAPACITPPLTPCRPPLSPPQSCSAPTVTSALPTSPTTATVVVNPPLGTTPTSYTVEVCPTGTASGSPTCVKVVDWPTNVVPFTNLTAGAVSIVGLCASGSVGRGAAC